MKKLILILLFLISFMGLDISFPLCGFGNPTDWYGISGLNWSIGPGDYWISFEVRPGQDFDGAFPRVGAAWPYVGPPDNPLTYYSIYYDSSNDGIDNPKWNTNYLEAYNLAYGMKFSGMNININTGPGPNIGGGDSFSNIPQWEAGFIHTDSPSVINDIYGWIYASSSGWATIALYESIYPNGGEPNWDNGRPVPGTELYSATFFINPSQSVPVPEPATMLLLGSGLIGLAGLRKNFRK